MILAGIDEAGLGPTLGPLTSARAALRVPDDWTPATPWAALAGAVAPAAGRGENRIAIADSKALYHAGKLAALELPAGAFSLLADGSAPVLDCGAAGADESGRPLRHPCYSGRLAPFPIACTADAVAAAAAALGRELENAGAGAACLRARALFEPEMNRLFAGGLNKNQVLLGETGRHLSALLNDYPGERVLAVVDKQGGRDDYLPFLTGLFPGAWVEELEAGRTLSRYRVRRAGAGADTDAQIHFQAKADAVSFPTALASMAAKYARERAMAELNVWFAARLPGLRPTAGYPLDAARWLADVREAGSACGAGLEIELAVRLR